MLPALKKAVSGRMKPPPLQSFRESTRDWLLCWDSLHAAINLVLVIILLVVSRHFRSELAIGATTAAVGLLAWRPVWYFLLPPMMMLALLLLMKLSPGKSQAEYPCPVCGYDVRETLSRCPECGTELQWGQLPDDSPPSRR